MLITIEFKKKNICRVKLFLKNQKQAVRAKPVYQILFWEDWLIFQYQIC